MLQPAPSSDGAGDWSKPIDRTNMKAGTEFRRIIVMPRNLFKARDRRDRQELVDQRMTLSVGKPIVKLPHAINLAALDQQETECPAVMTDDMGADLFERTPGIKRAIGHEEAMIAERGKATLDMPTIDGCEHLKR